MKRPCFDQFERENMKLGCEYTLQRFKTVKAGRDLERQLMKDLSRLISPIVYWIGRRLANKTQKQ